ncbi:MAG: rod shape-determining protein RodA [Candidatus Pacebacteria bacterium]|nr:rod shape-determining protein RodA [Candidatus Paceibacterota bacterium]
MAISRLQTVLTNVFNNIKSIGGRIDGVLVGAVVALLALSVVNLYGVGGIDHSLVSRQAGLSLVAIAVMLVGSFVDYRALRNWTTPVVALYGGALVLVMATLGFDAIRNIRAWIVLGSLQFEPSELMKVALIVVLAKYFSQRHVQSYQIRHVLASGLYAAVPMGIILIQPDLGSAMILGVLWAVILLAVGVDRKHLTALVLLGLVGMGAAWTWGLAPYQKDRILAFIDPYQDPTGYGYHIIQSKVAIGSGGLWGKGIGEGSQAMLGFLPEPYNDFAFASLAEQLGFAGVLLLLSLVVLVVWRIMRIGLNARNNFAKLYCLGVATLIASHAIISAGVNTGLLPITGIPFTFLSYGGSHLMSVALSLSIVQSINRYG